VETSIDMCKRNNTKPGVGGHEEQKAAPSPGLSDNRCIEASGTEVTALKVNAGGRPKC